MFKKIVHGLFERPEEDGKRFGWGVGENCEKIRRHGRCYDVYVKGQIIREYRPIVITLGKPNEG